MKSLRISGGALRCVRGGSQFGANAYHLQRQHFNAFNIFVRAANLNLRNARYHGRRFHRHQKMIRTGKAVEINVGTVYVRGSGDGQQEQDEEQRQ